MILRVLFTLQLLGIPKHALAFHVFPAGQARQMFRSSLNNNVKVLLRSPRAVTLRQQQQQRTAKTLTATAVRGSAATARATDSTGTIEASNAFFLGNDGQWIDYAETFRGNKVKGQDDSNYLRELTVTQLRQEARERGQTSTGSRATLMERLVSKQSPDPTRPRRRKHKPETPPPHGYVERQTTPRPRALHPYTAQLRVLSWNVNGIRAQLDKEEGRKAFQAVIAQERPHVLGVQEIRIAAPSAATNNRGSQKEKDPAAPSFVHVVKSLLPDYDTIWLSSFPPARSGYSGTAMFVRKKREWDIGCPSLLRVRGGIGHTEGDLEGRVTTAEYDVAFVVNVYTPNSGAGLKRLTFRTTDWDEAFAAYVKGLEKIKPVVVVGDLNVAHEDKDFYNPDQKRMRKAAGTTPEERSSFARNLLGRDPPPSCISAESKSGLPPTGLAEWGEGEQTGSNGPAESGEGGEQAGSGGLGQTGFEGLGQTSSGGLEQAGSGKLDRQGQVAGGGGDDDGLILVDTFRKMYPAATGVFSFWSVRAGNRPVNRGMRLDYCLASQTLVNGDCGVVHDAFVLDRDTVGISDHCPVGVVLRLGDHYHPG